jgi:hypothetical protein
VAIERRKASSELLGTYCAEYPTGIKSIFENKQALT